MGRKMKLIDCNPKWGTANDVACYLIFDCPEGHEDCKHAVPFTPALDGTPQVSPQANQAQWDRTGDNFETITLSPSIRRIPIPGRDDCALHIFIKNGLIEFCGDSR